MSITDGVKKDMNKEILRRFIIEFKDDEEDKEKTTLKVTIFEDKSVLVEETVPYMCSATGELYYIDNPPKTYDSIRDFFNDLVNEIEEDIELMEEEEEVE